MNLPLFQRLLSLARGQGAGLAVAYLCMVVLNITTVQPDTYGYLTVYPCSATRPTASNLNYVYRSTDGGQTWNTDNLVSSYGVWGDPVVVFDLKEREDRLRGSRQDKDHC